MKNNVQFFRKTFEEVLGIKLDIKNDTFTTVNMPPSILKLNPKSIQYMLKPLESLFKNEKDNILNQEDTFLFKQVLVTKYIYSLIDNTKNYEDLHYLIDKLQTLSNKTYEQNSCQMGFLLLKKDVNIKQALSNLQIDYLSFDTPLNLENIDKNKQALKLVDSLSICYVLDYSYKIVGLAKKRKNHQSLSTIFTQHSNKREDVETKLELFQYYVNSNSKRKLTEENKKIQEEITHLEEEHIILKMNNPTSKQLAESQRNIDKKKEELITSLEQEILVLRDWINGFFTLENEIPNLDNEFIQFIEIKSNSIEWNINPDLTCILSNGKWNIRNYELIKQIILEFLLRQYPQDDNFESKDYIKVLEKLTPRARILHNNIKQLSNKNIGALIVILKQDKQRKTTIYKELLSKKATTINEFTKIIKTDTENYLNIYSCDSYLFELISSVDGAILLDKNFNILSFGEMINNSIPTPEVTEAGARTLAAAKASIYGLSIKVSEDGDISIFEDGSPIIKL